MDTKSVVHILVGAATALAVAVTTGCSNNPVDSPPPTIPIASPAVSPPLTGAPAGTVQPLPGPGMAAVFDAHTRSLVVLGPADRLTVLPASGPPRSIGLPTAARSLTGDGDGDGTVLLAAGGGYLRVDIAGGAATKVEVEDHQDTDFTAITQRADGRVVLGSADGAVFTLSSDTAVGATLKIFARVDALVAQGDSIVVLDRGQTSVTEINSAGTAAAQALRAGEGAATLAADAAGRVLVTDTRGGTLLVYGTDPLILRQRYPVGESPYGVTGSAELTWVSQTATNTVIGYDLATGIPVEKVRHRTVQQPDTLAYDEAADTLYVVSGTGAGAQVIPRAGQSR